MCALERVKADCNVHAVYVRLGARRLEWAKAEELASVLGAIKPKTPVYCHAHSLAMRT
ncbi:MAG: hypothetical protein QM784_07575 [Polyangiaceae bacterium]